MNFVNDGSVRVRVSCQGVHAVNYVNDGLVHVGVSYPVIDRHVRYGMMAVELRVYDDAGNWVKPPDHVVCFRCDVPLLRVGLLPFRHPDHVEETEDDVTCMACVARDAP